MEECELFRLIPREKLDELFKNSHASAELDKSFLAFENVYKGVLSFVPNSKIIIDFGCAYGTQSWYFRDYKKYIGIDNGANEKSVIHTENSEYYFTSIQNFITNIFDTLNIPKEDVFAICSFVPDKEAQKMVRENFPYCLVYYPTNIEKVPKKISRKIIEEKTK